MMSKMIQASTLNALMLGNFDRTISVKEFLHACDTGIGTYTGLDGEAIFEDGVAYRATAEGKVTVMKPEDGVAFGTVAHFDEHVPEQHLTDIASIELLKQKLEPYIAGNKNVFYILKGHAEFNTMHVRSCFVCKSPTRPCPRRPVTSGSSTTQRCAAIWWPCTARPMSTASICRAGTSTSSAATGRRAVTFWD